MRNLFLRSLEKSRPELLKVSDDESYTSTFDNIPGTDCPERNFFERATVKSVQDALNRLPEKYKTPLILFYSEEWSYREISEGLDLPMGTVMSRIARGRDLMKKVLPEEVAPKGKGKLIPADFSKAAGSGKG